MVVSEELEYIIRLANAGASFGYLTLGYLEIKMIRSGRRNGLLHTGKKEIALKGIALLLFGFCLLAPTFCQAAQESPNEKFARPIEGSRMLAGKGEVPDCVLDCFIHLCGTSSRNIVVVCLDGKPKISVERWKQRGANSVVVIDKVPSDAESLMLTLLKAKGFWFESDDATLKSHTLFQALLRNVTQRGGVIGGSGAGAMAIAGFGLLPTSTVHFNSLENRSNDASEPSDGIHWYVPNSAALVFHHGRRVSALGNENVDVRVAGKNGWDERTTTIESIDAWDVGQLPSYNLDLLSWVRSTMDRQGPVFPPEKAPVTKVEKGTLILQGGAGVDEDTFNRFIDAAGGKESVFVCIPSASDFRAGQEPNSYSAQNLRSMGCKNVTILHATDPLVADQDKRFLAALKKADGIWIDGGRTYRMMDRFQGTKAAELMRELLERDGVIGGSSAGCQVAGDFLVRGNPRTNRDLVLDGYTRGFGFIEGVILDAHFLQRGRDETFKPLMETYPQMLGIGVDEKTAISIRGSVAEVLGSNAVSFYNMKNGSSSKPVILKRGAKYDLEKRKVVE